MTQPNNKIRQQSSGEQIREKGWQGWWMGSHPIWREFLTALLRSLAVPAA